MPNKKKKICKRKSTSKKATKHNSVPVIENKTVPIKLIPKGADSPSPVPSPIKKPETNKKQDSFDKGGVPRIYSPFNRFASTTPRTDNEYVKNMAARTYPSYGLTPKEKSYVICSCQTRSSRYLTLKKLAAKAIKEHRIFTIYGRCTAVRKALVERGWVEKIPPNHMNLSKIKSGNLSTKVQIHCELERLLLSNLVSNCPAYFIWRTSDSIRNGNRDEGAQECTIENKLRTVAAWTSKQGLCASMKRNYWFYIEDVSEVTGPRSYNTYDTSEVDDFVRDYKITACTSLLKWVLSMVANERPIFRNSGTISLNVFLFALNRCKEYLFRKQNKDIDQNLNAISSGQWNTFIKKYYRIIEKEEVFQEDRDNKLSLYLGYAAFLLKEIYRYRPQLSCEGCYNIWIIKPTHNSRGRGIRLASKLAVITNLINKANSKYVIQKYIEEPLLIHETKFDIRQYYLVTSTYPLIIWMYQDCYLKFSSQKYNLTSYHESIHLTNNAVQRKYTNCPERHSDLPTNNMWDSDMYKQYLNSIGRDKVWDNIIYPGMKKSIIAIMLSCQDALTMSKNRFELYGCDFILDKMYEPWLIEINSGPDLNSTTPVTAKICPAVVTDIVKVVIDFRQDPNSSTGRFECIYHQPMTLPRYVLAGDMIVRGVSLPNSYFWRGSLPSQQSYNDDMDIEIANSAIIKKIKQSYVGSIMVEPEENYSLRNEDHRSYEHRPQSDCELSVSATINTAQLEELMDGNTSYNRDTNTTKAKSHSSLSQTTSIDSIAKMEFALKDALKQVASTDMLNFMTKQSDPSSLFRFSQLDDGPMGKASAVDINRIKRIFDNYKQMEVLEIKPSIAKAPEVETKNLILEATSQIFHFINQMEKEYFSERCQ